LSKEKYKTFKEVHVKCSGNNFPNISSNVDATAGYILAAATTLLCELTELSAPFFSNSFNNSKSTKLQRNLDNVNNHLNIMKGSIGTVLRLNVL
jgi:hypothetical protein